MYYYFANISNLEINIIREANESEYKKFEENIKPLNDFVNDKKKINLIETSFKDIITATDILKTQEVNYTDIEKISMLFTTYLSLFKKYLDNWETYLKRRYGKESLQVKHFKELAAHEYDNYMEYRIFYRLRNYDQHCENLLSNITKEINKDGTISVFIFMNRNHLLRNFDEWKKEEKEFLNSKNNMINVMPLFQTFHKCVLRIHEGMIQIHCADTLFNSCYNIITMMSEFKEEDSISFICSKEQITKKYFEQNEIPLNIIYCQVPLCKEVLRIYLKDIQKNFLIVSYGAYMNTKLRDISRIIKDDKLAKLIETNSIINIRGTIMIIDMITLLIDKNSFCAILVKRPFYNFYIKYLSENIKKYLELFTR